MADNDSVFDKIFEFGMGMTMARQIPQMMEVAMPQKHPITNTPPAIKPDIANVYIANNNQQAGPFSEIEVKQLIANGVLKETTLAWMPNMPQWMPAGQIPTINKLFILGAMTSSVENNSNLSSLYKQQMENPIKDEINAALTQLGYGNVKTRKLVDEVLAMNPTISISDAIKEVLKKM